MQKLIQSLILAILPMAAPLTFAQEERFPSKPIQVIITSTPGSLSDVMARFYGNEMAKTLGQSTVVISKANSSGTIGTEFVKRAPADGYTLLVGGSTTMSANLFLVKNLSYDPLKDFEPVAQVSVNPLVLVVRAELPIKSVADLIAYAKARPGQMNYGVANAGGRVAVQLLKSITGIVAQDVLFAGASQAMLELAAGRLDFMITDPLVADTFVKQGKLRALAVTSGVRLASMPDLPTMMEAGVPGYDYTSYVGYFAPRGTPKPVIAALNAAFVKANESEEGKEFFRRMAMIGKASTPEELTTYQKGQISMWGRLVKEAGMEPQ